MQRVKEVKVLFIKDKTHGVEAYVFDYYYQVSAFLRTWMFMRYGGDRFKDMKYYKPEEVDELVSALNELNKDAVIDLVSTVYTTEESYGDA